MFCPLPNVLRSRRGDALERVPRKAWEACSMTCIALEPPPCPFLVRRAVHRRALTEKRRHWAPWQTGHDNTSVSSRTLSVRPLVRPHRAGSLLLQQSHWELSSPASYRGDVSKYVKCSQAQSPLQLTCSLYRAPSFQAYPQDKSRRYTTELDHRGLSLGCPELLLM